MLNSAKLKLDFIIMRFHIKIILSSAKENI